MNIAVCDDNLAMIEDIKKHLGAEAIIPNIKIFQYISPDELIDDIEKHEVFPVDLVLLDIEIGKQNGIDVAAKLQCIDRNIKIIFITSYESKYSQRIFNNVTPSGFIKKPVQQEILTSYINRIYLNSEEMSRVITLTNNIGEFSFFANEILYVESYHRSIRFHLKNSMQSFSKRLDDVASLFPQSFVRCHKSFIVNLNAVLRMETTCFYMIDGSTVSISKGMRNETRKAYFKYKGISYS